jgi:2-oxoglutarate dehydrogenase E1 component
MRRSQSVMASCGQRAFRTSALFAPLSGASASFETGTNSTYFERMHEQWQQDPTSVHASWRSYFEGLESGVSEPFVPPPNLGETEREAQINSMLASVQVGGGASVSRDVSDSSKVMQLIQGYQTTGHAIAKLDPLNLSETYSQYSNLARIYKKHS